MESVTENQHASSVPSRNLTHAHLQPRSPDPPASTDPPPHPSIEQAVLRERERRLVLLADPSPPRLVELAEQLTSYGYTVSRVTDADHLATSIDREIPAALIMDLTFCVSGDSGTQRMLQQPDGRLLPLICIADQHDLAARLQALRTGATAFLPRPIVIGALIDKLDALTAELAAEPYRVLIVDDQLPQAKYAAVTLQRAGILTEMVTEPLRVLERLAAFRPDLILMDVHMPECTGMELAAIIRQHDAYMSTPIVFLSGETDREQQLSAMQFGGDEFVTKPIRPMHLVAVVQTRIRRLQVLRALMVRDSLTGLLNHVVLKERLEVELARAHRDATPLVFTLLDIDHFKAVNDTHGHAVGDSVIKSLARLLQQRLRKSDSIGRYGGEEFGLILPNTDAAAGIPVLETLRRDFAHLRHPAGDTAITATFSCGVATAAHGPDVLRIVDAADRALYQAKRQGRNQVVLAERPA